MHTSTDSDAKLNIFLVEDNADTRQVLAQVLTEMGHEVYAVGSMQSALREFTNFGGNVLLSDIGLPDGDGWELLRELRRTGSAPYAIAMSGFGTLADISASRAAGFHHHLVKPIELDALERLLEGLRH